MFYSEFISAYSFVEGNEIMKWKNEIIWISKITVMHMNVWYGIRGCLLILLYTTILHIIICQKYRSGKSHWFQTYTGTYQSKIYLNLPHFWRTHQRATRQIVSGPIKTPSFTFSEFWSYHAVWYALMDYYLVSVISELLACFSSNVFCPGTQYKCITWSSRVLLELVFPLILVHTDGTKFHIWLKWTYRKSKKTYCPSR